MKLKNFHRLDFLTLVAGLSVPGKTSLQLKWAQDFILMQERTLPHLQRGSLPVLSPALPPVIDYWSIGL